ncbi:MAG: hypothetical protein ACOYJG_09665 [Prevotella sp.]
MTLMVLGCAFPFCASAHNKVKCHLSADIVSKYVWRGVEIGSAQLQPTLKLSYGGFSVSALGSVGIVDSKDDNEFDFCWRYDYKRWHVLINDNWLDTNPHYFEYAAHSTSHNFEGNIGYDAGFLTADWYTYFAGKDYNRKTGKRSYSSWMKFTVPFELGQMNWCATLGIVPFESENMYETDGFAVNLIELRCTKDIRITNEFSVPIFGALEANPSSEKAWFVFGLTLQTQD